MLAEEQSRKRFKATAIVKPDPDVPVQALAASAATATAHVEVVMRQRGSFTLAVEQCLIQFLRQRTTIYDAAKWSTDTTTIPGLAATGEQGGDVLSISISVFQLLSVSKLNPNHIHIISSLFYKLKEPTPDATGCTARFKTFRTLDTDARTCPPLVLPTLVLFSGRGRVAAKPGLANCML